MTTAQKLKGARAFRNMTQQALSDATGISVRLIQKYESGVRSPKVENLEKLASALHISPKALAEASLNTCEDVLFMLFELEKGYGKISIELMDGKASVGIDNRTLSDLLLSWKKAKEELTEKDFQEWEMTYSQKGSSLG